MRCCHAAMCTHRFAQARELDDGEERNSMRAVMLWALTEFIRTLDEGAWRLTAEQREHAKRMGLLHLQAYQWLVCQACSAGHAGACIHHVMVCIVGVHGGTWGWDHAAGHARLDLSMMHAGEMLWGTRPKQHALWHLVTDLEQSSLNPKWVQCDMEESFLGDLKRIGVRTHGSTVTLRMLQRYMLGLACRYAVSPVQRAAG